MCGWMKDKTLEEWSKSGLLHSFHSLSLSAATWEAVSKAVISCHRYFMYTGVIQLPKFTAYGKQYILARCSAVYVWELLPTANIMLLNFPRNFLTGSMTSGDIAFYKWDICQVILLC